MPVQACQIKTSNLPECKTKLKCKKEKKNKEMRLNQTKRKDIERVLKIKYFCLGKILQLVASYQN